MVWSPDWNFSFSEGTEITLNYQKVIYVIDIGNRLNNNSIHLAFALLISYLI